MLDEPLSSPFSPVLVYYSGTLHFFFIGKMRLPFFDDGVMVGGGGHSIVVGSATADCTLKATS